MNVGDLTFSGTGVQNLIFFEEAGGSLNGTSGNSVTFNDLQAVFDTPFTTGSLSATGALVQTSSTGESPVADLTVDCNASFDQGSEYFTVINEAGTTPGTDYSQLSASGDVSLGGAELVLEGQHPSTNNCPGLDVGDVYTLITTTGSLSGTFFMTPDGSTMQMLCSGGTAPTFRINYTANSVTATVVSDTTTIMAVNPSSAATNQPVALTANVTAAYGSGTPSGMVEFDNNGTPISGCSSVPLDDSGAATCQASFPASSSPESLTADYTPASSSGYIGSSSTASPVSVTVGKNSSSTAISTSSSSPSTGQTVTYTATVTPAQSGPTEPSGTIQFADDGSAIGACSSRLLTHGSSSSTATCTTSYDSAGSHSITASYSGDSNFVGSSSSARPVTVSGIGSATTGAARPVGATTATLNGLIDTHRAGVTWQFQFGRSTDYGESTPVQTIAAGETQPVAVSAAVGKLLPNTAYNFRLIVVTHQSGATPATSPGQDLIFTTKATGKLLLRSSVLTVIGRFAKVPMKCQSSVPCRGSFSVTSQARLAKDKKLSKLRCIASSFKVRAGHTKKANVRIHAACLSLLKQARKHRIKGQFTSILRTGQVPATKKLTLEL